MDQQQYLQEIDRVIEQGPFQDTWESLSRFRVPAWYQNGKFGIFIHWGVFSVPEHYNDWYLRDMHLETTKTYRFHRETYGDPKEFGYKDFIPLFRAEKFDAAEWIRLFQKAGARFIVPVAEHHDGFQMYDSELSDWCAAKMGPKKDTLAMLKEEAEKNGLVFGTSSHRAEHYWFENGSLTYDSGIPKCPDRNDLYWPNRGEGYGEKDFENIMMLTPEQDFLEDWLVRTCELVDKYRPKIVYFDWWIQNLAFKPYLKKFAAYYYNRAIEWGEKVAIDYKHDAFHIGTAVHDIERGQADGIQPDFWQCDTSVSKNSWVCNVDNDYKKPEELICNLVDVVSKNGAMLLNIGPRSDGTIPEKDREILESIGKWLAQNGEGIYNTRYFKVYGEGPTEVKAGYCKDTERGSFTSEDFRFTMKNGFLYAFVMKRPKDGCVTIRTLGRNPEFNTIVRKITVLENGSEASFEQTEEGLTVHFTCKDDPTPLCLKISYE